MTGSEEKGGDTIRRLRAEAKELPSPSAEKKPKRRRGKGGGGSRGGGDDDGPQSSDGQHTAGNWILRQFNLADSGLWWQPPDDNKSALHLCGPIEALARTRDERGENWGVLLAWSDGDGRQHEFAMPRGMLAGDGASIRQHLLERGLYLSPNRAAREAFITWLSTIAPAEAALSVEQVGWHKGDTGLAFVLPDAVYGPEGGERMILQTIGRVGHSFDEAGGLADWQREVAAPCAGNTRLLLAISAAFAGPLLYLVGEESGGINLLGQSRTGKSTAVFVGASVWGRGGRGGYVRQWRSTSNGLESIAAAHCDALLAIDEMGQMDPREVGEAAYMLANESGKSRAGRDGGARHVQTWRCLILSSSEHSLGELVAEGGRRAKAGQEVRIVDVSADTGSGLGLFEELHGAADADAFARQLRDASGRCYGTAARAFLQYLCNWLASDHEAAVSYLKQHREEFTARSVPPNATGQVRSVAGRFALISAAGELATRFGITGLEPGAAQWAAGLCFKSWVDERGTVGAREDETGVDQVRAFIEAHGAARFELWEEATLLEDERPRDQKVIQRAGFKRYDKGAARWEYYILPTIWKQEVCKGSNARRVAQLLVDRGFLVCDSKGKSAKVARVPGHGTLRLYHVRGTILGDADS